MTDEAPKEIWANLEASDSGLSFLGKIEHRTWDYKDSYGKHGVTHHYTLTDHARALVEVEREKIAQAIWDWQTGNFTCHVAMFLFKKIRARTDKDTQAALADLLKAERAKALRGALEAVKDVPGPANPEDFEQAILALIEKEPGRE